MSKELKENMRKTPPKQNINNETRTIRKNQIEI